MASSCPQSPWMSQQLLRQPDLAMGQRHWLAQGVGTGQGPFPFKKCWLQYSIGAKGVRRNYCVRLRGFHKEVSALAEAEGMPWLKKSFGTNSFPWAIGLGGTRVMAPCGGLWCRFGGLRVFLTAPFLCEMNPSVE